MTTYNPYGGPSPAGQQSNPFSSGQQEMQWRPQGQTQLQGNITQGQNQQNWLNPVLPQQQQQKPNPYSYGQQQAGGYNPYGGQQNTYSMTGSRVGQQQAGYRNEPAYWSEDGLVSYDQWGNRLDSLGNVATGGGGGARQQGQQPGWGQPGGPNWSSINFLQQQHSGEGSPPTNPYSIGNLPSNPYDSPYGVWGNMPGTFMDFMAAPPEYQNAMLAYMNPLMAWNTNAQNTFANQRDFGWASYTNERDFQHQKLRDDFQMGLTIDQNEFNKTVQRFNMDMEQQRYNIDYRMAEMGMSLQQRQQAHTEMMGLGQLELSRDELTLRSTELARRFGLDERQVMAAIDNQKKLTELEYMRHELGAKQWGMEFDRSGQQWQATFGEGQRQFDATFGLERDRFGEGQRQFDVTFGLERDRFGEGQRQFDMTFGEGSRQFDATLGEGRRQFDLQHDLALYQNAQRYGLDTREQQRLENELMMKYGLSYDQLAQAQHQFNMTFGLEQQRFGLEGQRFGEEQRQFDAAQRQQMQIEQMRLAAQNRQANMAAFGRVQAPNTKWLRAGR